MGGAAKSTGFRSTMHPGIRCFHGSTSASASPTRFYPQDEAPAAYKDFNEVLKSVETADLAHEVARLRARFVIKDADKADD